MASVYERMSNYERAREVIIYDDCKHFGNFAARDFGRNILTYRVVPSFDLPINYSARAVTAATRRRDA